jgi:hypothetical protein
MIRPGAPHHPTCPATPSTIDISEINSKVTASNHVEFFIGDLRYGSTTAAISGTRRLGGVRLDVTQARGFGGSADAVLPDIEESPAFANARFFAQGRTTRPAIRDITGTEIKNGFRNRHLAAPRGLRRCEALRDINVPQPWDVEKAEIRSESITKGPPR